MIDELPVYARSSLDCADMGLGVGRGGVGIERDLELSEEVQ